MEIIKRQPLMLGIILMFAFTWPIYNAVGLVIGWGLSLAALIVTVIAYGWGAMKNLLRRFLIWRVALGWYAVALIGPIIIYLLTLTLYTVITHKVPDTNLTIAHTIFANASSSIWPFLILFFITDLITNGEELAWRGFVLPHLQARQTALMSSLLLGFLWGLWHLPRFWVTGDYVGFAFAISNNLLVAIIYTWVYNETGGSLLLVTLLHAAFNTAYVFLPVNPAAAGSQTIFGFTLLVEILAAVAVIVISGPKSLARQKPAQM
jgi:membrane protease YdiL (CAAX protease family)